MSPVPKPISKMLHSLNTGAQRVVRATKSGDYYEYDDDYY